MFPRIGVITLKWMVKIMENSIKMDDLGVPLFLDTPICPEDTNFCCFWEELHGIALEKAPPAAPTFQCPRIILAESESHWVCVVAPPGTPNHTPAKRRSLRVVLYQRWEF